MNRILTPNSTDYYDQLIRKFLSDTHIVPLAYTKHFAYSEYSLFHFSGHTEPIQESLFRFSRKIIFRYLILTVSELTAPGCKSPGSLDTLFISRMNIL